MEWKFDRIALQCITIQQCICQSRHFKLNGTSIAATQFKCYKTDMIEITPGYSYLLSSGMLVDNVVTLIVQTRMLAARQSWKCLFIAHPTYSGSGRAGYQQIWPQQNCWDLALFRTAPKLRSPMTDSNIVEFDIFRCRQLSNSIFATDCIDLLGIVLGMSSENACILMVSQLLAIFSIFTRSLN